MCMFVCVCAWTFIHVQVLRREWQRYVPTDTKGAYDMSRFRLNVHSLSESLWKDCLNVFQVWYFLQGSWNHQLANQPYYGRWCVILLLKRNLNCLTLTLFFPLPESFTPFRNLKVQPSNGKCTKSILAASSKYFAYRYSCLQLLYRCHTFVCQTCQTPSSWMMIEWRLVVCDPPWILKFLVFPSGWIWEENIKLPEDVTLRPDVLITLLASSPDWGVKNWKAGIRHAGPSTFWYIRFTPWKTNMTMEMQSVQDVCMS